MDTKDNDILTNTPKDDESVSALEKVVELIQKHKLIQAVIDKQSLPALRKLLEQLPSRSIGYIIEALPYDDQQFVWNHIRDERKEEILLGISDEIRVELVSEIKPRDQSTMIRVFDLHQGCLRQIPIESRRDLAGAKPIWVDLVKPEDEQLSWSREIFDVDIPNPTDLTDLEASARFYVEDNGEIHLHTNFLLDRKDESRNVTVAFILYKGTLFSVRNEELPVFRLQRLRAKAESGYVSEAKDILLDLYAADVEYSANALENVYSEMESISKRVLGARISDEEAEDMIAVIASEEDLNGRIRRNVLDTRNALSFLMRRKIFSTDQHEEGNEILRDIDSLDGHTAFLFNKIKFLLDATDSTININQNKDIKRLTVLGVVFMPLNILAGIGGMSEFSMMTQGVRWQVAYGLLILAMLFLGWLTYVGLKIYERQKNRVWFKSKRGV
ncbi:MAG: magnesium transporter CorA [Desulfamplus sp.]|nr:magnesium transporter CorA [Desulfamplus sp.]